MITVHRYRLVLLYADGSTATREITVPTGDGRDAADSAAVRLVDQWKGETGAMDWSITTLASEGER